MLLRVLSLYLCFELGSTGHVAVQLPYANPAGIAYINGKTHAQAGLLAGPVRYRSANYIQGQQLPIHAYQVAGTPSVYSYNLPEAPVSVASHPFYTYNHAAVTPVIYGAVQRPPTVVFKPQPIHPVITQFHPPDIQPTYIPTVTTVPVHIPIEHVTPTVPIIPPTPVKPVTPKAHVPPVTTTVTKTITQQHGYEQHGVTNTQTPLPVIRSRKYKVRRPAIHNQFYDIEERVIIRPVGNALIELEQPLSQTETGIGRQPDDHQFAHSNNGQEGGHTIITQTTTVTQRPGTAQQHPVYTQPPVYNTPETPQHPLYNQQPVHNTPVAQYPYEFHQIPVYNTPTAQPHPVIIHTSNTGQVPHPTVTPQTPIYVNHVQPVYIPTNAIPVTTIKPPHVSVPVVTTPHPSYIPSTSTDSSTLDYDDTIVIDARSGGRASSSTENPYHYTTIDSTAKYRTYNNYTVEDSPKRGDIAISYATEATHQSLSNEFDNKTPRSSTIEPEVATSTNVPNPTINARFANENNNPAESRDQQSSASRNTGYTETTVSSPRVIVSSNVSPDQARANQEQFIRLLSERDSISEVGFSPNSGTSGSVIDAYVRGRVLSATPAPRDATDSSRTVNIRRIIVSRPIETEQEVEVREQVRPVQHPGYHTTSGPHQVPVYSEVRPPAFANDYVD
ncbi:uncharacterized protein LOC129777677 [Toxorhynchites rutilus septentrionalis]|uniref:uncharacterized protein LOC129777677 n=1 Tax=Toxorhynchites rutilus septentrionalis TaxID=329112 RepID=UPI00247A2586|nr:uncharacterized protein LOC129777677 [Toxorhynchites rutilus septentrionalis]